MCACIHAHTNMPTHKTQTSTCKLTHPFKHTHTPTHTQHTNTCTHTTYTHSFKHRRTHTHTHFCPQVYGKGKAAVCRKHVQTLNMKRGEQEKATEFSVAMAMQENHPPEDYASTFQTSDHLQEDELVCTMHAIITLLWIEMTSL